MPVDPDVLQRLTRLETQLQHEKEARAAEVADLEAALGKLNERIRYYDHAALKWGSFCLGMVFLGGLLWAGVDKLTEKVMNIPWRLP